MQGDSRCAFDHEWFVLLFPPVHLLSPAMNAPKIDRWMLRQRTTAAPDTVASTVQVEHRFSADAVTSGPVIDPDGAGLAFWKPRWSVMTRIAGRQI
ncbi:MAG: hypothetical protein JWM76_61 [Pseudonocardiales bacterium]|nr:hypothetical protein [Pseudonocardiales bacterium]